MMSFEEKVKLLKKLKESEITDRKKIDSLTAADMLVIAKKGSKGSKKDEMAMMEGLIEIQSNGKDLLNWLMNDGKE